jgi:hypothetical protein
VCQTRLFLDQSEASLPIARRDHAIFSDHAILCSRTYERKVHDR